MVQHEHSACLEGCLAFFLPPIAIWVHQGECCADVLINWLLNILSFGILGIFHAFWFCFIREDDCVQCRDHHHNTVIIVDQHVHQPAANPTHGEHHPPPPPSMYPSTHVSDIEPADRYEQPPPAYDEAPYSKRRPDCCVNHFNILIKHHSLPTLSAMMISKLRRFMRFGNARPPPNSPAYRYTILMSLSKIYKGCEVERLLAGQNLETYHGMHLLVLAACEQKSIELLEVILRRYIEALLTSVLWCHKAQKERDVQNGAMPCAKEKDSRAAARCRPSTQYYEHLNDWNVQYPSLGQLIRWIVESDFSEAVPALEAMGLFDSSIHVCAGTTGNFRYEAYTTISRKASALSHFAADLSGRWRPDDIAILGKLLLAGVRVDTAAVAYAIFHENAQRPIKYLAWKNVDFSTISERNPLHIPDVLYVAVSVQKRIIPVVLKYGRVKLELTQTVRCLDKNGQPLYLCCLFGSIGYLHAVKEFCAKMYICPSCQMQHNLQNKPLSLLSMARLSHRCSLTPSKLLMQDLVAPQQLPEEIRSFLLLKKNPFDAKEFIRFFDA